MLDTSPPNARVAAELAPLRDEPEQLRETWDEVVERHGPALGWPWISQPPCSRLSSAMALPIVSLPPGTWPPRARRLRC